MTQNRQILLAARPVGYPKESDFRLAESDAGLPASGQVLVKTLYLSLDPYMRGIMNEGKSYAPPVSIGQVMPAGGVGQVVASADPAFREGDMVEGGLGWQEYALVNSSALRKVEAADVPVSAYLSLLGGVGMTAYFGLLDVARPQPGETVVVSGAAGAVGSLVGQIAKIKGCRAVGIAGTDEKVQWITSELGFDGAFNYKTEPDYGRKLQELCPGGVDVYFDNVGGKIADAAMWQLNRGGRVAVCGQISQYNLEHPEPGPRLLPLVLAKQVRVQGLMVGAFRDRFAEGRQQMVQWYREGRLKYRESVVTGLENAPGAFIGMLKGANVGKQLVKVAEL